MNSLSEPALLLRKLVVTLVYKYVNTLAASAEVQGDMNSVVQFLPLSLTCAVICVLNSSLI